MVDLRNSWAYVSQTLTMRRFRGIVLYYNFMEITKIVLEVERKERKKEKREDPIPMYNA